MGLCPTVCWCCGCFSPRAWGCLQWEMVGVGGLLVLEPCSCSSGQMPLTSRQVSCKLISSPRESKSVDLSPLCPGILAEQFVPTGPHLQLYSPKTHSWTDLTHWHYTTMYLFFLLSGIVDIVSHSPLRLPLGLDRLALGMALLVEGESHLVPWAGGRAVQGSSEAGKILCSQSQVEGVQMHDGTGCGVSPSKGEPSRGWVLLVHRVHGAPGLSPPPAGKELAL